MFFFERTLRLGKEFLKFKKYKKMNPVLAVFTGIFLIPFAACFFIELGFSFLASIFFSFLESPIKYLHNIMSDEGKKTRPATEFIIYFFAWPTIFMAYCFYAMLTLFIVIDYFFACAFGYVASLGGYKFHVSPYTEDIEKEVGDVRFDRAALVFIIIHASLLCVGLIAGLVILILALVNDNNAMFAFIAVVVGVLVPLGNVFSAFYVPIFFANGQEPKPEEPKKEEPKQVEQQPEQPAE